MLKNEIKTLFPRTLYPAILGVCWHAACPGRNAKVSLVETKGHYTVTQAYMKGKRTDVIKGSVMILVCNSALTSHTIFFFFGDPHLSLVCVHAHLSATLWTAAHQAPLSLVFPRQEYWSRLPSSSKGSSWLRDRTQVSCIFCTGRQILYHWVTWEAPLSDTF